MDKTLYILYGLILALFIASIVSINDMASVARSDFDGFQEQCALRGITCERTYMAKDRIQCFDDCIDFTYKYYKVKDGGFGADNNCWCIKEGTPIQIW